ncbi:PAS domain-containing protein [Thalassobaculum sp.]|uniref:PAS domain-containing protein n=1 Tax=Thalassobaculum sp. TaxID=2022740 RepID=UPI0032ECFDA5
MLRSPDDLVPDGAPDPLRRFLAYWIDKAAGRTMPAFVDIDATEIPWALSRLYVVRAVDRGADFVYRLTGSELTWNYGFAIAGKRIGDLLAPAAAEGILDCWRRIVGSPAAYYSVVQHLTTDGMALLGQRVTLPLGPSGGPPDHIIGMTLFETIEPRDDLLLEERDVREARWVELSGPAGMPA